MNNEIRVPVKLEVLQDSITQLKSILSSLKPESGAWKELQNILRAMTREADALQTAMNKPFGKQSQFNAAEKGVGKIEDALERARIVMGRIKFSDIKLDSNQEATLKSFEAQLEAIAQKAKNFKATLKTELQNSAEWADVLKIDPNAVTHSYDQIVKEVEKKVTKIEQESKKATEALHAAEQESTRIDASKQFFSTKKSLSKEGMGEDFSKFFLTDKNGDTRFRSGGKAPFYEWMRSNLLITPQQYDEIKNKSVKDLQAWIKDFDIEAAIKKVDTKKSQANTQLADLTAQRAQTQALQDIIAKNQDRISKSEASLSAEAANVTGNMNNFKDGITNATRGMQTFQNGAQGVTGACAQLSSALSMANAEYIKFSRGAATLNSMRMAVTNFMGFYQVVNLVKRSVKDAMNHIKQLDQVMNGIAIVTDMSTGDLWKQIDAYSTMASRYGTSIQGAYEVSQIYYQQGLETADVLTLTNETLKLAKISGMDYATATDYMTTAIRGFKIEMQDAARVVDVYSALAANTAVSQEELAVAMSKTASSMEGVGSTFEEASAMIGTMVAVTRESATNIGSAMKSIASRYGELTKDPMTLVDEEGEALSFNRVDTALQSVGISMKTVDGQFRNFTDVIIELGEKWNELDSVQQRYIATQFAGNRQQSRFLALVSNVDTLKENIEVAKNSEDTGTIQALKSLDSIPSKLEQVQVAWQQFYTTIGAQDVWKGALDGIKVFLNTLNGLPKAFDVVPLGAINMIADVVILIKELGAKALEGFANIYSKLFPADVIGQKLGEAFYNAGRSASDNLAQGMNDNKGAVEDSTQTLANTAAEKADKTQKDQNQSTQTQQNQKSTEQSSINFPAELAASEQKAAEAASQRANETARAAANAQAEVAALKEIAALNQLSSTQLTDYLNQSGVTQELTSQIKSSVFLNNTTNEATNAITDVINTMMSQSAQLSAAFSMAGQEAIASYITSILSGISAVQGESQQIAENIAQGLISGMLAKTGAVQAAGIGLGQAGIEGVKTGAGTHSESVFTHEAGNNIGEGLINGTTEEIQGATNAGNKLGSAVVDAVKETVKNNLKPSELFAQSLGKDGLTDEQRASFAAREKAADSAINEALRAGYKAHGIPANSAEASAIRERISEIDSEVESLESTTTAKIEAILAPLRAASEQQKQELTAQYNAQLKEIRAPYQQLQAEEQEMLKRHAAEVSNLDRNRKGELTKKGVKQFDALMVSQSSEKRAMNERLMQARADMTNAEKLARKEYEDKLYQLQQKSDFQIRQAENYDPNILAARNEKYDREDVLRDERRDLEGKLSPSAKWYAENDLFTDEEKQAVAEARANKEKIATDRQAAIESNQNQLSSMQRAEEAERQRIIAENNRKAEQERQKQEEDAAWAIIDEEKTVAQKAAEEAAAQDAAKEQAARKAAEEEIVQKTTEEVTNWNADEDEAAQKAAEEAAAQKAAEEEAVRKREEQRKAEQERQRQEEAARQKIAEEEDAAWKLAEEEEAAAQRAAEEAAVQDAAKKQAAWNAAEEDIARKTTEEVTNWKAAEEIAQKIAEEVAQGAANGSQGQLIEQSQLNVSDISAESARKDESISDVLEQQAETTTGNDDATSKIEAQIAALKELKQLREEINSLEKGSTEQQDKQAQFIEKAKKFNKELADDNAKKIPSNTVNPERFQERIDKLNGLVSTEEQPEEATEKVLVKPDVTTEDISSQIANGEPYTAEVTPDLTDADNSKKDEENDKAKDAEDKNKEAEDSKNAAQEKMIEGAEEWADVLDEADAASDSNAENTEKNIEAQTKGIKELTAEYDKLASSYEYDADFDQYFPKDGFSGIALSAEEYNQKLQALKQQLDQTRQGQDNLNEAQTRGAQNANNPAASRGGGNNPPNNPVTEGTVRAGLLSWGKNHASGITTTAAAISTLSGAVAGMGEAGPQFAAGLQMASGALKIFSGLSQGLMSGNGILALVSGLIALWNAIDMFIEDDSEKLERLTKEAEELSNVAKIAKNDFNIISKTSEKYEELKEKRYESAEASEEYQAAVDELTSKFPELIMSFDEAGNAIVNEAQMTDVLTEAREKSAQAAYDAAKAEVERLKQAKKVELEEAKKSLKANSGARLSVKTNALGEIGEQYKDTIGGFATAKEQVTEIAKNVAFNYVQESEGEFNDFINGNFEFTGDLDDKGTRDKYLEILNKVIAYEEEELGKGNANKDLLNLQQMLINYGSSLESNDGTLPDIGLQNEAITNVNDALNEFFNVLNNKESTDVDIFAAQKKLSDTLDKYRDAKYGITEDIIDLERNLGEGYKNLKEYESLDNLQIVNEKLEVNKFLDTILDDSIGALNEVLTNQIYNKYKDYNKKLVEEGQDKISLEDYLEKQSADYESIFNSTQEFYASLSPDGKEIFNAMMKNQRYYNAHDIIDQFSDMPQEVQQAITAYFSQQKMDIFRRVNKNIKASPIRQGLIDILNSGDYTGFTLGDEALINQLYSQYEDLSIYGTGEGSRAKKFGNSASNLIKTVYGLEGAAAAYVEQVLSKNGLTPEGLNKSINEINAASDIEGLDDTAKTAITDQLSSMSQTWLGNIILAAQARTDEFISSWKDVKNNISAAQSGMDIDEAQKWLNETKKYMQAGGLTGDIGLSDLQFIDGKFYGTVEQIEALRKGYIESYKTAIGEEVANLEDIRDNAKDADLPALAAYADQLGLFDNYFKIIEDEETKEKKVVWKEDINQTQAIEAISQKAGENIDTLNSDSVVIGQRFTDSVVDMMAESLKVVDYLTSDRTDQQKQNFKTKLQSYLQTKYGQAPDQATLDYYINSLEAGGAAAVEAFQKLNPDATAEDFKKAYSYRVDEINSAMEEVGNLTEGSFVTGPLRKAIEAVEVELQKSNASIDLIDENGVIKSTEGMIAVYQQLFNTMKVTAGHTQADLNNAYVKVLNAQAQNNIDALEIIKSASDIGYDAFNQIITRYGLDLETVLSNSESWGIKDTGYGSLKVTDWSTLINQMQLHGIDTTTQEFITAVAGLQNAAIESISTASSYMREGTDDISNMQEFTNQYNDLLKSNKTVGDLFSYDTVLNTFTLNQQASKEFIEAQKQQLEKLGLSGDAIDEYIKDQTDTIIRENIELDSFLNASTSRQRNDEANKLITQIRSLNNYKDLFIKDESLMQKIYNRNWHQDDFTRDFKNIQKQYDLLILETLESGGQAAVDLLKQIKPDASADELSSAYSNAINRLNDALSDAGEFTKGSMINTTSKLYQVLRTLNPEGVNADGVITATYDMVAVYKAIYAEMSHTAGATTAGLNDAFAQLLTAQDQINIDITDTLNNGAGMSYADFGSLLAKYDIKLEDYMRDHMDTIMRDGFGNIRITNWDKFAQNIWGDNLDQVKNTPEYMSAFKAYNDGLIELNQHTEQIIAEEIVQIENAKPGDQLNLSYLWTALQNVVNQAVENISPENYHGNVDLANRPIIPAEKMKQVFSEFEDDYATLYSQSFMSEDFGDYTRNAGMLFTSITASGEIVEDLASYVKALYDEAAGDVDRMREIDKIENGGKGLMLFGELFSSYEHLSEVANDFHIRAAAKDNINYYLKALQAVGANYVDGILTLSEDANILAIANILDILAELSAIDLGEEGRAAINDAVNNLLTNIASLITNGINGDLTSTDAVSLSQWYRSNAKNYTGATIAELDFTKTAEGLKLTETSLANVYDLMKRIDEVRASALLDDIISSRESFQSLTGALREFNDAMRLDGIDDATNKLKNFNGTLSNTAQMMQDVVQKAMTSPESMNFMSNKLPDDMQTAVNAWENASQAIKTLTASEKSGYMGVQDFYNIVNTASSLMVAAGKEFKVAGMDAATLLQEGAKNVKIVDGKLTVDISSAGLDIQGSVGDLKKNLTTGINELASAEIAIIDAEIEVLEILAAMEQMSDMVVDIDNNGLSFEISDIFDDKGNFTTGENSMQEYLKKLREIVGTEGEIFDAFNKFKIGTTSLYDLIHGTADEWVKVFGSQENVAKFMQKFSKGIEGWDLEGNLQQQVLEFMKGLGQDYSIDLGDSGVFHISASGVTYVIDFSDEERMNAAKKAAQDLKLKIGKTDQEFQDYLKSLVEKGKTQDGKTSELTFEENLVLKVATGQIEVVYNKKTRQNEYKVGGRLYKSASVANAVAELIQAGATADWEALSKKEDLGTTGKITGKMTVGKAEIEVTSDGKGNVTYQTPGGEYTGSSLDELYTNWFEEETGMDREENGLEFKKWQVKQGISVETVIDINGKEGNAKTNKDVRAAIQKVIDEGLPDGKIKYGEKNSKSIEVDIGGGVTLTIPKEKLKFENGKVIPESLQEYLRDNYNTIDLDLKDTISKAITEAFESLPELIKSLNETDTQGIEKVASAIGKIYTNADNAYQKIAELIEQIAKLAESLSKEMELKIKVPEKPEKGSNLEDGASDDGIGASTSAGTDEGVVEPQTVDVVANITSITPDPVEVAANASEVKVPENTTVPVKAEVIPPTEAETTFKGIVNYDPNVIPPEISTQKGTIDWEPKTGTYGPFSAKGKITWTSVGLATGNFYKVIRKPTGDKNTISGSSPQVSDTNSRYGTGWMDATGTLGLARAVGTPTLMGELGPELVVSNGQYFVVGTNGPEMVPLAKDAIVFNHLQTKSLLTKGMSKERGRAVTNERNAVAFATGNINGGPAMASASAALAQLKALRAMWESLRKASVSDLAGAGGGGGGGGGEKAKIVDPKAWVDTVERWYNLTQEIARLEEEITHQETIRTKLQSDWQKNGNAYYRSQKKSLDSLNQQIAAQEQLNISRREYFNKRVEALKDEALGQIYTFDEEGQLQFRKDVTINGKQGGMEFLTDLYGFDNLGKANYTNKEKYEILMASGFADYMKYDSNGMEIKVGGEGTEEDYETFYEQATQAFRDRLDQYNDATQSLLDEINQGEDDIEKLETDRNELMKEIRDNQMELENEILDAIVESRQRQIDALQDQRDALEETTGKYIEGLSDALEKERDMYERQESQDELNRNKRRLAILQRSGGSAADISSLQSDISSQERDLYFDSQQAQIDAIQEASDLEIERLDKQIELMTETLEFQQEYGLLWGEVYEVMDRSSQEIVDFINGNSAEFWKMSTLAQTQAMNDETFKAEYWTSYKDDLDTLATETREQQLARDYATFDERMKAEYGNNYDASGRYREAFINEYRQGWNIDEATEVARKLYHDEVIKPQEEARRAAERAAAEAAAAAAVTTQASSGNGGSGGDSSSRNSGRRVYWTEDGRAITASSAQAAADRAGTEVYTSRAAIRNQNDPVAKPKPKPQAHGGYVGHGLYELGELGTETVLTASQTRVLRNNILSNRPNSLISLLKTYNEGFNSMDENPLTTPTTEDNSTNIENINLTMNVQQMSNDYDARRAGQEMMNEVMRIARKSGATNSVRR